MIVNASDKLKGVSDPNAAYQTMIDSWKKNRAVCSGQQAVKAYDSILDVQSFNNLLIPFSPSMGKKQYEFYKAEAELPGIVSQFSKMIVGGLLRKSPSLELPEDLEEDALNWISNNFAEDDSSLVSFMDSALWDELQTSRSWVYLDYPVISDPDALDREDLKKVKPFPVLWKGENVINWRTGKDEYGKTFLKSLIVRGYTEVFQDKDNMPAFHPSYVDTVWVHHVGDDNKYRIYVFQEQQDDTNVPVANGQKQTNYEKHKKTFKLEDVKDSFKINGESLNYIPAWPLNGQIEPMTPIISPLVDKEVALYNKVSRRNHLLYGAATYTPVIYSDMSDDDFDEVVSAGLGSWVRLGREDKADILATPTEALQDMDRAIAASIEEMAKLGIRMLTPESAQSGVALEIRNAAQNAQLGSLNIKVSATIKKVITCMINWHYGTDYGEDDIEFTLSNDFNPVPLGADWLRLATEWYENGLIPRSVWILILRQNDMLPADYDDEEGESEINQDQLIGQNVAPDMADDFQ